MLLSASCRLCWSALCENLCKRWIAWRGGTRRGAISGDTEGSLSANDGPMETVERKGRGEGQESFHECRSTNRVGGSGRTGGVGTAYTCSSGGIARR